MISNTNVVHITNTPVLIRTTDIKTFYQGYDDYGCQLGGRSINLERI